MKGGLQRAVPARRSLFERSGVGAFQAFRFEAAVAALGACLQKNPSFLGE
jgi:hypothetical protein